MSDVADKLRNEDNGTYYSSSLVVVTFLHRRNISNRSNSKSDGDSNSSKIDHNNDDDVNDDDHEKLISILISKTNCLLELTSSPSRIDSSYLLYPNIQDSITSIHQNIRTFPMGIIIDHHSYKQQQFTDMVNNVRCTLALDSKRPTVHRRFYHDIDKCTIVQELEQIIYEALTTTNKDVAAMDTTIHSNNNINNSNNIHWYIYCNRYIRILEYDQSGIGLAPHTDGTKVCDTTHRKSTHTLLFYLCDCNIGGETVIMDSSHDGWSKQSKVIVPPDRIYQLPISLNTTDPSSNNTNIQHHSYYHQSLDVSYGCTMTHVCLGISPKRGRIFVFPHEWPHAGAICTSIPKIMLRAEITIQYSFP
jgi:hypothetical protein